MKYTKYGFVLFSTTLNDYNLLQTEEIGFFSTLSINLLYIVASLGNYLVIVTLLKDLNAVELFYSHIQQVI